MVMTMVEIAEDDSIRFWFRALLLLTECKCPHCYPSSFVW